MNDLIKQLDQLKEEGQLSEVSYGVLKRLAKKRKKERFWFKIRNFNSLILGSLYLVVLISLGPSLKGQSNYYHVFANWLIIYWHFLVVACLVIGHLALTITSSKYDEADKKYDRVRKEVVDRTEDIWNQHISDRLIRPTVLQWFDKEDVNLFHK